MKEALEQDSRTTNSASISTFTLLKFVFKLIQNQPSKILTLSTFWLTRSEELNKELGKELVEVLKDLEPNFRTIIDALLASTHVTSIDDLYETIKPLLDNTLNKNISNYGVNLKELDIDSFLTESYIKNDVLPIFLILRDIPKFCKSIKEKNFLKTIQDLHALLLTHLETDLHSEIRKYLLVGQDGLYEIKSGENPDPALVSQIKKILNALVYAEKVISFINSLDLNPDTGFKLEVLLEQKGEKQVEFLTKVVWYLAMKDSIVGNLLTFNLDLEPQELEFIHEIEKTINYVRQAQTCLLEVDLPIYQIFETELNILSRLINFFQKIFNGETQDLDQLIQKVFNVKIPALNEITKIEAIAEGVGDYIANPLGTFVEELKPRAGVRNLSVLTSQLGMLPSYLDQLTKLIYTYGAGQPQKKLLLSDEEKEAHKNAAIKLFFELSNFDNLLLGQKASAVIFPIRKEGVLLTQATYQQLTRTNEAIGEMVAHVLSLLKEELFTRLVTKSDKFEFYSGFASGVSTKFLMLKFKELYQVLVDYANYVVDLKSQYPDLLQLDNTSFLSKRLENMLQEKNECQLKFDRAKKAKKELQEFIKNFPKNTTMEEKLALNKWYQSFKLYVIEYNPRLSVLIDTFLTNEESNVSLSKQELDLMFEFVDNSCEKEISTFGCYLTLADSYLTKLPGQVKGKLYSLDSTKQHSFLLVNEPKWLHETHLDKLHENKNHDYIDDLSALAIEKRASLYDYHSIRLLTLKHIQQEIDSFLQQLLTSDWSSNSKSIAAILDQYRVLQPYFVDSISQTNSKEIDKFFVDILHQLSDFQTKLKNFIVVLDTLNACMKELKQKITVEISNSERRRILFILAHQQINEKKLSFSDEPLTLESELVKRQDKWIRHQHLSRGATELKDALLKMLTFFDPSLKLSVAKDQKNSVVPFPEMEDDLEALKVPSQVSWAKRMLNVVHYIDSNFRYLESLDRDIHKTDITHYFLKGPLIEGLFQIKPFVELTKAYQTLSELVQEPTGQIFLNMIQSPYHALMETWEKIHPLYFANPNQIEVNQTQPIKSSSLWYPILAALIFPEHLEYLAAEKAYTSVEAQATQQNAKEIVQYIEKITEEFQASQYFYLLLKSPYVLFVFLPELKAKVDKLRANTNQITVTHLQDIQSYLYSLLLEADALELKLGLHVGLISQPTQLILDKLLIRFIEPLSISFQKSAQLVEDPSSFLIRLQANRQKKTETEQMLESEKTNFQVLDYFLKTLQKIKVKLEKNELITAIEKEEFKTLYWSIYPVLQAQQNYYQISLNQKDKSVSLDKFCEECFDEQLKSASTSDQIYHYTSLKDVMYLTIHVHAAKEGNINTLETQSIYLNSQAQALSNAKQYFLKTSSKNALHTCIKQTIDVQIDLICKQTNQLVYLEPEYKSILLKLLQAKKGEIFTRVVKLPVDDIERVISEELQKQFNLFREKQYPQLVQLDTILAEIERFQLYCQKEKMNPIYENTDPVIGTLGPKIALLNRLKTLAQNNQLTVQNRIDQFTEEAKKESFYTILMSHDKHFKFEFKALKRLFLNLFHSIFNFFGMTYHPEDFYSSLTNVIQNKKIPSSSLAEKGFFSKWPSRLTSSDEPELTSLQSDNTPSIPQRS